MFKATIYKRMLISLLAATFLLASLNAASSQSWTGDGGVDWSSSQKIKPPKKIRKARSKKTKPRKTRTSNKARPPRKAKPQLNGVKSATQTKPVVNSEPASVPSIDRPDKKSFGKYNIQLEATSAPKLIKLVSAQRADRTQPIGWNLNKNCHNSKENDCKKVNKEVAESIQDKLLAIGCLADKVDGAWGDNSKAGFEKFAVIAKSLFGFEYKFGNTLTLQQLSKYINKFEKTNSPFKTGERDKYLEGNCGKILKDKPGDLREPLEEKFAKGKAGEPSLYFAIKNIRGKLTDYQCFPPEKSASDENGWTTVDAKAFNKFICAINGDYVCNENKKSHFYAPSFEWIEVYNLLKS